MSDAGEAAEMYAKLCSDLRAELAESNEAGDNLHAKYREVCADRDRLREQLEWYGTQAEDIRQSWGKRNIGLCAGADALMRDGGKRARSQIIERSNGYDKEEEEIGDRAKERRCKSDY